ncbi:MAG: hypothetical protein ACTTH8_01905 [Treponema sp.]
MRELVKGIVSVIAHFIIGILCCVAYAFIMEEPEILPFFAVQWRLSQAFLLFIEIMPTLICSAILFGYVLIFGRCGQNTVHRYSAVLLRYLREVFIILVVSMTVYFIVSEAVSPMLIRNQEDAMRKTKDYDDFMHLARTALKEQKYETAYHHAKTASLIWKDSPETRELLDTAAVKVDEHDSEQRQSKKNRPHETASFPNQLSVDSALLTAEQSMQREDFYSAHFYAMKAYHLAPANNPRKKEAMRLAAQAWNTIEQGSADIKADFDVRLFYAKKEAYTLMQEGSDVQAYYRFLHLKNMLEQTRPQKKDPDIERFLEITHKNLLEKVFFIDETDVLPIFEKVRNVRFSVYGKNTQKTQFKLDGLAFIYKDGEANIYGRNCEITRYKGSSSIEFRYFVPFVKFIPGTNEKGESAMRLLLQAVDRDNEPDSFMPKILEGTISSEQSAVMMLPFSYSDFQLIIAASEGEKTMTLPELYAFRSKSSSFGFSQEIYNREILKRVCADPFSILLTSLYLLILAWALRIPPHTPFKWYWIFTIPIFVYVSAFFVELVRYCSRLMITFLTEYAYSYSSVLVTSAYLILFIMLSFLFFAQRSDI